MTLTSSLTTAQLKIMLECEVSCIRASAHWPELMFDVMPTNEPLAKLNIDWMKAEQVNYD